MSVLSGSFTRHKLAKSGFVVARLRAEVLACAVGLGMGAGLLACSAIVGFPDRTLEPASDSGETDGGSGGDSGDAGDGGAGDASASPLAQLDAGNGCADYPAAVVCEDFDHGSLLEDGWQLSEGDAGTLAVIATTDASMPNSLLVVASPDGVQMEVNAARVLPVLAGPQSLGFDFLARESPQDLAYIMSLTQDDVRGLALYISGGKLALQESCEGKGRPDVTLSNPSPPGWHRIELDLSPATDGGMETVNATIDGKLVLDGGVPLNCSWNDDALTVYLGFQYENDTEATSYAYDNLVYQAH